MSRLKLPAIRVDAKYAGLKFEPTANALSMWDKSIEARAPTKAEVRLDIMGVIGEDVTDRSVRAALSAAGKAPLRVYINSPGGGASEGIAIYGMLLDHPAPVTVEVLSIAASVASLIAMAADRIEMRSASRMMIHSSHAMFGSLNKSEMRKYADILDSFDQDVAKVYAARSGKSVEQVMDWMSKETYMNAEQAVANGFADVVLADKKARAQSDHPILASIPASLLRASAETARPVVRLSLPPGASGSKSNPKGKDMRTIAEQITAYEAKRAASAARMSAIMESSAESGSTLDETQTQEYDGLSAEVKAIDGHIVRLKDHEKHVLAKAEPAPAPHGVERKSSDIIVLGPKLEPGQRFARYAMAMLNANGNPSVALNMVRANRRWMDTSPELEKVLMTAVATGDTTTAGWASELVYAQNLANEFIEFLRPMTILGRMTGVRRVPFNVRMGSQTAASTGNWVGQAKPIPVSKLTTSSLSLGITKAAGIVTIDDELMRSSSPSAELLVRDDLAKSVQQLVDLSFIDPNQQGVANIQPMSILFGVTPITPSGTTAAAFAVDIASLFAAAIAANLDPTTGVFVMSPTTALKLSLMLTTNGQPQYPNININGGSILGLPVIVSNQANIAGSPQFGQMIVLILQNEILLADDGQVTIEVSKEAALELLDNPTNSGSGGTTATSMVSMFQTHSAAIKAVRYINWTKRRSAAAAFIQAAAYTAQ